MFEGDELPFFMSPLQFPVLAQKQEADHELRANSTQEAMQEHQRVWEQDTWRLFLRKFFLPRYITYLDSKSALCSDFTTLLH